MLRLRSFMITTIIWTLTIAGFMMLFTVALYNLNFGRRVNAYRTYVGYEHRLTSFYSGHNKMTAYIFGEDNDIGLVVISHGLGGGGLSYLREIMYFVDNGWRVFAFDKTGSHNSEGSGTRGLPQSAIDLHAALNYIASRNWEIPIVLYGHSWGGFAVAAVLNFDHDIKAVVSLSGFAEPLMMLQEGAKHIVGSVSSLFTPFLWTYQWILFGNYASLSAIEGINSADVPVKIIHGRTDSVVSYEGAGIIAHRDRISNPNTLFVSRYYPNRSGHNDLTLDPVLMHEINEFFMRHLNLQS